MKVSEYCISSSEGDENCIAFRILGEEQIGGERAWKVEWKVRSESNENIIILWISKSTGMCIQLEMDGETFSNEYAESMGSMVLSMWFSWIESNAESFKFEDIGQWREATGYGRLLFLGSELRTIGSSQLVVYKWRWEGYRTAPEAYRGMADFWLAPTNFGSIPVKIRVEVYEPAQWTEIMLVNVELTEPQPLPNVAVNARIDRTSLKPGEQAKVDILYSNTGNSIGAVNVTLYADNVALKSWLIAPKPGEEGTLTYYLSFNSEGPHIVKVGDNMFTVTVSTTAQPARFEASELSISPTSLKTNEKASISVKIKNAGGESGSYDVVLKINEQHASTKTVNLGPGESTTITFHYTPTSEGTYNIEVNGLSGTFTVTKVEEPSTLMGGIQWQYIAIIAAVAAVAVFLLIRRKSIT
ncbi:MAG: CARDB domain-containing protein [Thermofilaceae archaeon]